VDKEFDYDASKSPEMFKLAWYTVASKPGVLLVDYKEEESQDFRAEATFETKIAGEPATVRILIEEAHGSASVSAWSKDEAAVRLYLETLVEVALSYLTKYSSLAEGDQQKLKKVLMAKTCFDRIPYKVLNKASVSEVYFQVAHGREMVIKATEGEDTHPVALTTSGWLAKMERMPRDAGMPGGFATELAKKSIEWKKGVQGLIEKYL
jgi:hypothetical protein